MKLLLNCVRRALPGVRWLAMAGAMLGLAGCATAPLPSVAGLWLDAEFKHKPDLVTIGKRELFELDPELLAQLRSTRVQSMTQEQRLNFLIDTVMTSRTRPFSYASGHTTVASETWRLQKGDCLSLTVLAFAMAQELRLNAAMQEVPVPPTFDRRGGIDYLVGHVNVHVNRTMSNDYASSINLTRGVVIDFEPTVGSARLGEVLSADAILARFYNNLAAEHMAANQPSRAYAHFKAAIQADPQFTAAYSNLALLYSQKGFPAQAEQLLLQAMKQPVNADVAIRALHRLMVAQGRAQEAGAYQALLVARQEQDPYYWIGVGIDRYTARQFDRAATAFERAEALTSGFAEVHRFLAMAYFNQGHYAKAKSQVAALLKVDDEDPALGVLKRKMRLSP